MTNLSPVAQAILDAMLPFSIHEQAIAAALRTATDEIVPELEQTPWGKFPTSGPAYRIRTRLLAIANELETICAPAED